MVKQAQSHCDPTVNSGYKYQPDIAGQQQSWNDAMHIHHRFEFCMVTKAPYRNVKLVGLLMLLACSADKTEQAIQFHGNTMGTTYSVQLDALPQGISQVELKNQLEAILETLNQQMSTYDPESEITQFNHSQSTDWFPVSDALVFLTSIAKGHSLLSDGAFDITVGPLVELWGFGPQLSNHRPATEAIQSTQEYVGDQLLEWRSEPSALRKQHPQLQMDLSAIAKGYGVDLLAQHLNGLQVNNYLVEIGGELRAVGLNPERQPWQIGIQQPDSAAPEAGLILSLSGYSVATSGDYLNYYIEDGKRYSHIIDPRTGYPVIHQTASVTVVAETTTLADVWATTLLVLGEEAGSELAELNNIAAVFLVREGTDDFSLSMTSAMIPLLKQGSSQG